MIATDCPVGSDETAMKAITSLCLLTLAVSVLAAPGTAQAQEAPAPAASEWVFPKDPDILGFKLLMTSDEVQSALKKGGYKIENIKKRPTFAQAVAYAIAPDGKKPNNAVPEGIKSIAATKIDDGIEIGLLFTFIEDLSLTPSAEKCAEIVMNRSQATRNGPDPRTKEAYAKMKAAVLEKYGPTSRTGEDNVYYATGDNSVKEQASSANENAPDFRYLHYSGGRLELKDCGFVGQRLGLLKKKTQEAIEASKKEAPKAKI